MQCKCPNCNYIFNTNTIDRICIVCNTIFKIKYWGKKKTCSKGCLKKLYQLRGVEHLIKYWTGRKLSDEHRKKLSIAHKGKPKPWLRGKHAKHKFFTKETKLKMSLAKRGSNHPNWKGGISKLKNYNRITGFRRKQMERKAGNLTKLVIQQVYEDNIKKYGTLTCYLCSQPIEFGQDHLEHKIPLSKNGTNNYDNLEIACKTCNLKKHTYTYEEFININK